MKHHTELAWAAGFFDGEGSVLVGHRTWHLTITQVEKQPLDRFAVAVGLDPDVKVRGPWMPHAHNIGRKPFFNITLYGRNALPVLTKIWPYLSDPKKLQATRVLAERGQLPPT